MPNLSWIVKDESGNPVPNVTVSTGFTGITDGNGFVNRYGGVAPGSYEFSVSGPSIETFEGMAVVGSDESDPNIVNVVVKKKASMVNFDHPWTGKVENRLRSFLSFGLAGPDGMNGQAAIDEMNAIGGIYSGGEFQKSHNNNGMPTYGFPWFFVSYRNDQPNPYYEIVEFATPPAGNRDF
jgi:hypothetical protein